MRADLQDAAGDVRGDLGVWRILVFALRLKIVLQTRLPQSHERRAMPLHRARLPDRRGDARDADLHHRLVIVISHVILQPVNIERKQKRNRYRCIHTGIRALRHGHVTTQPSLTHRTLIDAFMYN